MRLTKDQKFLKRIVKIGKKIQNIASYSKAADLAESKARKADYGIKAEKEGVYAKEKFEKVGRYIIEIKRQNEKILRFLEKEKREEKLAQKLEEKKRRKEEKLERKKQRKLEKKLRNEQKMQSKKLKREFLKNLREKANLFKSDSQEEKEEKQEEERTAQPLEF